MNNSPVRLVKFIVVGSALITCGSLQSARAQSGAGSEEPGEDQDKVVVIVGNRGGTERTVINSPTPIDVLSGDQIRSASTPALVDSLAQTLPSFNAPAVQATGRAVATIRTGSLRGLGPERTLFLVNGKRRHTSASFNPDGLSAGSAVDLDMIPSSAISRVEVLRSAASAQYGSDAIAGVINIVLREENSGFHASTQIGQNMDKSDGKFIEQQLNYGSRLGEGYLNISLDAKYRGVADRSQDTIGTLYNPLPDGSPDPREATAERHRYRHNGQVPAGIVSGSINLGVPVGDSTEFYSFTTAGYRNGWAKFIPRLPKDIVSLPEIYPNGFYPKVTIDEFDVETAAGLTGEIGGWKWDGSLTFARNASTYTASNTLNPSLGPTSPTTFLAQKNRYLQYIASIDVSRSLEIGLGGPLEVAFGGDIRRETFEQIAGDPLNYTDGGYVIPSGYYAGRRPSPYLQGVQFVSAADAGKLSRNIYSAYLDTGFNLTKSWYVGLAGRFQHFDDSAGSTANGKVTTRFEILPGVNIRGSAGTGFRAPSIQQQGFKQTNAAVQTLLGVEQFVLARYVAPEDPIAVALGATPLKPEKSKDFSVGISAQPLPRLTLSADYYTVWIDDRITIVSSLTGAAVNALLGLPANYSGPANRIQYYTNAIDTKTRGLDLVASYRINLETLGKLQLNAAYNYNRTTIEKLRPKPAVLAALGTNYIYFSHQTQGFITNTPRSRIILGGDWSVARFTLNAKTSRYGQYTEFGSAENGSLDFHYPARWITDMAVTYQWSRPLRFTLGATNIFNVYPRKKTRAQNNATTGFGAYGSTSPFGMTGGFYYARVAVDF